MSKYEELQKYLESSSILNSIRRTMKINPLPKDISPEQAALMKRLFFQSTITLSGSMNATLRKLISDAAVEALFDKLVQDVDIDKPVTLTREQELLDSLISELLKGLKFNG